MAFYRCGGGLPTQQKNNEVAKTTNLVVTPDDGYVLEKVTVAPTPSEPGSATAPLSGTQNFTPSSGKYFNSFAVTATPSQSNYEITAGTADKTITPPTGKLISGGTVHPTPSSQGSGTSPVSGTQTFTPASGQLFSSFKVTAPTTETKTITAGTADVPFTASSGKLISSGTVHPTPSEPGSATATTSVQTKTPSSGKLFSSFTINPQQHSLTYGSGTNQIVLPDVHNYKTINYNNEFKSDCIWLSPSYNFEADTDSFEGQTVQIGYVENSSFSNLNDIYVSAYELFRQNSYGWTKNKPSFKSDFNIYQYDLIVIAYFNKLNTVIIDPGTEYINTMKFYYFSPKYYKQYINRNTHNARYTEHTVSGVCARLVADSGDDIREVTINDSKHITFSNAYSTGEISIVDNTLLIPVAIFGIQRNNAIGISANCSI